MPSYTQIASDFALWGERFDTGAEMSREEFDALTVEAKVSLLADAFGPEAPAATPPVDVLAVMGCAAETLVRMKGAEANARLVNVQRDALTEARAAVDELIKASNEMLRVERTQGVTDEEFEAAVEALDAALTRVQGGA